MKVGKVAESLGDSRRRIKLRDASEGLVAPQAMNKQELVEESSLTREVRAEGPENGVEHAVVAGIPEVDLSPLLRIHTSLKVERLRFRMGGGAGATTGGPSRAAEAAARSGSPGG